MAASSVDPSLVWEAVQPARAQSPAACSSYDPSSQFQTSRQKYPSHAQRVETETRMCNIRELTWSDTVSLTSATAGSGASSSDAIDSAGSREAGWTDGSLTSCITLHYHTSNETGWLSCVDAYRSPRVRLTFTFIFTARTRVTASAAWYHLLQLYFAFDWLLGRRFPETDNGIMSQT